ncbi:hypothetical protein C2E23DRAFT_521688 [Lenzites betulinus]|nr:hypothetical protein C2E23DRAFT_521588 [Lenzites betulinus]KAH9847282.1 hypothetical protein C2E23DRAFT_521688 [Lenzites betulinus]
MAPCVPRAARASARGLSEASFTIPGALRHASRNVVSALSRAPTGVESTSVHAPRLSSAPLYEAHRVASRREELRPNLSRICERSLSRGSTTQPPDSPSRRQYASTGAHIPCKFRAGPRRSHLRLFPSFHGHKHQIVRRQPYSPMRALFLRKDSRSNIRNTPAKFQRERSKSQNQQFRAFSRIGSETRRPRIGFASPGLAT